MRLTHCLFASTLIALVVGAGAPVRADFLYVSRQDNLITRIDTATQVETTFASLAPNGLPLSTPGGMAFDGAGNLYVVNNGNSIVRFTPGGVGSFFVPPSINSFGNSGLAFDGAGNLYVATTNQMIERYTPGGVGSVFASTGGINPYGLAFDRAGNLYLADNSLGTIERYTPGGVGSVFASRVGSPVGLAFDGAGNLYVALFNINTIERYTPGGVGSVFASTGLKSPYGLAFDGAGNLYAANIGNNTIERYTPGGVGSLFATESSTAFPTFLAFQSTAQAVPEPSSMILLGIGGVLGLGYATRRRGSKLAA